MTGAALLALAVWAGILFCRGRFWFADQHLSPAAKTPPKGGWPDIAAVIPARDEADSIASIMASNAGSLAPG